MFLTLLIFFKITFFEKLFLEYNQSVKQFGYRSGCKLLANDISRRQLSGAILDVSLGSFIFIFMDHDTLIKYIANFRSNVRNPKTIFNCQRALTKGMSTCPQLVVVLKRQPKKSYNKTIGAFCFYTRQKKKHTT